MQTAERPEPRKAAAGRRKPLYRQMVRVLEQRMRSGQLPAGQQAPSEAELISEFRVSSTTARRCLNELAQRGLVQRIQGKGTFVLPQAVGTSEACVGVFYHELLDLTDTFASQCLRGISLAGKAHGVRPVLLDWRAVHQSASPPHALSDLVRRHQLQGLLIISPAPLAWFEQVLDDDLPVVSANFTYQDSRIAAIVTDSRAADSRLAEQIRQHNHPRIVIIRQTFAPERLQGVQMLASFDVDQDVGRQGQSDGTEGRGGVGGPGFQWRVETFPYWDQSGQLDKLVTRLLSQRQRPTLFWARNYELARDLLDVLEQRGCRVPQDVSVVFTGVSPQPCQVHGMFIPIETITSQAVALLTRMMQGEQPARQITLCPPIAIPGPTLGPAPV